MVPINVRYTRLVVIVALSIMVSTAVMPAAAATTSLVTFGRIKNLSANTGLSKEPVIASVGTHVYVAWEDRTNGRPQVFFVSSSNSGANWGTIKKFTRTGSATAVQIAATGSYVFLVWKQNGQTVFAASSNNGGTFGSTITFAEANGAVFGPALATNGTKGVYLLWGFRSSLNTSLYAIFSASHNGGLSFRTPKRINVGVNEVFSAHEQQITAQRNYVYIVSEVKALGSLYVTVSPDGGKTFLTPIKVTDPSCVSPCLSREAMIAASANDVYVTWTSNLGGSYQGYVSVSHDRGATWTRSVILSETDVTDVRELQVAACAGSNQPVPCKGTTNVYVTARAQAAAGGPVNQFIVVSHDNGTTFGKPFDLAMQKKGQLGFGGIGVSGASVFVFWAHKAPVTGIVQMWLQSSLDQGKAWQGVQQVSASRGGVIGMEDSNAFHDQGPMISANGGMVFCVWQDNSSGNGDVNFVAGTP